MVMIDSDIIKKKKAELAFFKELRELCKKHPDVDFGECYEYGDGTTAEFHILLCDEMVGTSGQVATGRDLDGLIRVRENAISKWEFENVR